MNLKLIKHEKALDGSEVFFNQFLSDRLKDLDLIKSYVEQEDLNSILNIVHQWKGFSKPYGFDYLGELSSRVEVDINDCEAQGLSQLISDIETYLVLKKSMNK